MAKDVLRRCSKCNKLSRGSCCGRQERYRGPLLYNRKQWKIDREQQLAAYPLCHDCDNAATEVHHLIRHKQNEELFFSSPLMSLCHACHVKRTRIERLSN
jgi:hypothetical protein